MLDKKEVFLIDLNSKKIINALIDSDSYDLIKQKANQYFVTDSYEEFEAKIHELRQADYVRENFKKYLN